MRIKEGHYNAEQFYQWVVDKLLPQCQQYPLAHSVIVLDNASWHVNDRVCQAVKEKKCLLKFLPPYLPDYNPIELTFSVLKAWTRQHFESYWPLFEGDFERFLRWAVEKSQCDRFAVEHFHFSAGGYIFEGELETFYENLKAGRYEQLEDVQY